MAFVEVAADALHCPAPEELRQLLLALGHRAIPQCVVVRNNAPDSQEPHHALMVAAIVRLVGVHEHKVELLCLALPAHLRIDWTICLRRLFSGSGR